MREFDEDGDGDVGPELGMFLVRKAVLAVAHGDRINLDAVRRRLEGVGRTHADLARSDDPNWDVGELGVAMLPGWLSVIDRLEAGDAERAYRRWCAVLWCYGGIRWEREQLARPARVARHAAIVPVRDGFRHDPFAADCPCGPVLQVSDEWELLRHRELLRAESWATHEMRLTIYEGDDA